MISRFCALTGWIALSGSLAASALLAPARAAEHDVPYLFEIDMGPLKIGEERFPVDFRDFPVQVVSSVPGAALSLEAEWVPGSLEWFRNPQNLQFPRARMKARSTLAAGRVSLRYMDKVLSMQEAGSGSEIEFFVSLIQPGDVSVVVDGKPAGTIVTTIKPRPDGTRRIVVDYSCAPYLVELSGIGDEFATATCRLWRMGEVGEEIPMLEVYWFVAGARLPDGTRPPFIASFRATGRSRMTLLDREGRPRAVEISASLPPRLPRLRFAGGLGPYNFVAQKDIGVKKTEYAPSVMLYGNFFLTDELSIRGFEAAVSRDPSASAFFNNFGVYFAYELFRGWDKRMQLIALLGFQGLTFAYDGLKGTTFSQAIFPQGFELMYFHAFGKKGYNLGMGMFILPSVTNPYSNLWVRYGKRVFGEVNYISWSLGGRLATMWGVSIGFPLAAWF
ncbi:MAG: hypothetical protein HYW49_06715 [Deltaproteobacteria bacterium]|nr:hypothetical protein [Deltaproteobacteria bacterium]